MGQGKSQARLEDLTLRKNHHTPSQALGGGGVAAPVPPTPEEEMLWRCGGHAGLMGSGVLQEPHLQHHASSIQRFHAGQGHGRVPEPFPSPLRRPQKSGE